ncbi:MAG: ISAzo13 family transposase, partial [Chloroflexi bacterium]|nr:ISAzo13 family transposase [Chloroflexota bacterium]
MWIRSSGIICIDNHSAKGNIKTEDRLPNLAVDIHDLIDKDSQVDPKFRSPFRYSRVSARAVRQALISEKGYLDDELPCVRAISTILNRLNISLKKTLKTTPIKKIPETNDIFDNVHQVNDDTDMSLNSLRISVDAKSKVKIGNLSRGGKDRRPEANKADDHDTDVKATLVPIGILEVVGGELTIIFGQNVETSDLIADCIEKWWEQNKPKHPYIDELVINLDNGPNANSNRTQFLKRMIAFSEKCGLKIRLLYYPPCHRQVKRQNRIKS